GARVVAPRVAARRRHHDLVPQRADALVAHRAEVAVEGDEVVDPVAEVGDDLPGAAQVAGALLPHRGRHDQARPALGQVPEVGGEQREAGGVVADAGSGEAVAVAADGDVDVAAEDAVEVRGHQHRGTAAAWDLGDHVPGRVAAGGEPGVTPQPRHDLGARVLGERRGRGLGQQGDEVDEVRPRPGFDRAALPFAHASPPSCSVAIPSRSAYSAAWVRLLSLSFEKISVRRLRTVFSLTPRLSAISWLVAPWARCLRISSSRSVSSLIACSGWEGRSPYLRNSARISAAISAFSRVSPAATRRIASISSSAPASLSM